MGERKKDRPRGGDNKKKGQKQEGQQQEASQETTSSRKGPSPEKVARQRMRSLLRILKNSGRSAVVQAKKYAEKHGLGRAAQTLIADPRWEKRAIAIQRRADALPERRAARKEGCPEECAQQEEAGLVEGFPGLVVLGSILPELEGE